MPDCKHESFHINGHFIRYSKVLGEISAKDKLVITVTIECEQCHMLFRWKDVKKSDFPQLIDVPCVNKDETHLYCEVLPSGIYTPELTST